MLYVVRRADFEVEDNVLSVNPVYMFCNTETGTLHFRRKSDLIFYKEPILGAEKNGVVREIGDDGIVSYILARWVLSGKFTGLDDSSAVSFAFYTSQLLVKLTVRKSNNIKGYTIFPIFKTRLVKENKDRVLFLPLSLLVNTDSMSSWSWDSYDDSDRQYSKLRVDALFDLDSTARPSWVTDVYFTSSTLSEADSHLDSLKF